ncbi:50S ribosomal protein L5 [bacterium]|nr:50S ribosomal protein L5 [bacterium]
MEKAIEEAYLPRLYERYVNQIVPEISALAGTTNRLALPRIEKIVISMGFGRAATAGEKGRLEEVVGHLSQISGQKPVVTVSKKAVSSFKLREGMKIGAKVTLRGNRAFEFLDRFITVALPRVRDFRGVSNKGFDGHGNYNLGVTEQTIFPEIQADRVQYSQGMNITIVIKNATDEQALDLLKRFGMPFRT